MNVSFISASMQMCSNEVFIRCGRKAKRVDVKEEAVVDRSECSQTI